MARGDLTEGRRLPDAVFGKPGVGWDSWRREMKPGDYMKVDYDGTVNLWICDPLGHMGRVASHTITEHDDWTITVSPSILGGGWHGHLEHGVWRKV